MTLDPVPVCPHLHPYCLRPACYEPTWPGDGEWRLEGRAAEASAGWAFGSTIAHARVVGPEGPTLRVGGY